jgi:hypothetical protein
MPLTGNVAVAATVVSSSLERVDIPALDPNSGANNPDNPVAQMGWATEGYEDDGAEMDVPADVAIRAVYLALKMPEMPGFLQFVLRTPAHGWQQTDFDGDALSHLWDADEGVLRVPFRGRDGWDPDDLRAMFLICYYDDSPMDLGITDQWLEVAREVEEGDLVALPALNLASPANNDHRQMGWATEGFEDEATPLDVAVGILARSTHLVLEMPEAPHFLQFILQTPVGNWWQQTDYGEDDLDGFWDEDTNRLSVPITGEFDPDDFRAKFLIAYYDDGVMDLGITGQWLLVGPPVEIATPDAPPELPETATSLPFNIGLGDTIWGDKENQLGWNGDERALSERAPFDGGGLTSGLMAQANWFVIYVDNAPDTEAFESVQLMMFGTANGWDWPGGDEEYYIENVYDTFVPGAFAFPIDGHPFIVAAQSEGSFDDRNFGMMFQYDGGLESLGITGAWFYAELPGGDTTDPTPTDPDPTPAPADPTPTPPAADDGDGIAWWVWVLIVVGVAVVVVVVVVVAKKKK